VSAFFTNPTVWTPLPYYWSVRFVFRNDANRFVPRDSHPPFPGHLEFRSILLADRNLKRTKESILPIFPQLTA